MVAVPAATPVTTPVEPTLAIPVLLLDHAPMDATSVSVVVLPGQTAAVDGEIVRLVFSDLPDEGLPLTTTCSV